MSVEFFQLRRVDDALALFLAACPPGPLGTETLALSQAVGRVLPAPAHSPEDLPGFARTAVDGYALAAADTFGASEALPAYLTLVGEVLMGQAPPGAVAPGQCMKIATGGMLPAGADAAVMVEYTEEPVAGEIAVLKPAAPGENIIRCGEDCLAGGVLVPAPRVLHPADLGVMASAGMITVNVSRKPRVAVISTGDELVAPSQPVGPGQIRDSNTTTLMAAVVEAAGEPVSVGRAEDDPAAIDAMLRRALECDVILISGGSSVGTRDMTGELINRLGPPGSLVHGVSLKPGKPTILAVCDPGDGRLRPVVGLPGHPVSATVVFGLFVAPLLRHLLGLPPHPEFTPTVRVRMKKNIASAPGRTDVVRVALHPEGGELWAEPVLGKSGLLTTLVKSQGTVTVPPVKEGIQAGDWVDVVLF